MFPNSAAKVLRVCAVFLHREILKKKKNKIMHDLKQKYNLIIF